MESREHILKNIENILSSLTDEQLINLLDDLRTPREEVYSAHHEEAQD